MLQAFPLLAVSLIVYALLNFLLSTPTRPWYDIEAGHIALKSGDIWHVSAGHAFLLFSLALLFIEILRATRSNGDSLLNHAFSVFVFICALLLFIMVNGFGNSVFFIFTAMTLLDFMAGFIITTVAARRDFSLTRTSN